MAPKQPRAETTEVVDWTWAATLREAYQQLCAALLDRRDWFEAADIQRTVLDVFGEYPLFDDEESDILDVIVEEIRELAADGDGDPWPAHVAQALIEVLREPDWLLRSARRNGAERRVLLQDLQGVRPHYGQCAVEYNCTAVAGPVRDPCQ